GLHVRWAAQHPRTPQLYRAQYGADGQDGGDGTGPGGEWELRVGGPAASIGPRVRRWLAAHALDIFSTANHTTAQRTIMCTADQAAPPHGPTGRAAAPRALAGVAMGDPRSRWGSCSSTGRIRYNWRLIMAPDFVRHAIVAHEIAHLAHMNHGPQFYALVDALVGEDVHARSRGWLRQHGGALHQWRFDAD
ncbi:MAG: M48 family metallopeptidase, partial [Sphingopyxis sp.]